MPRGSQCFVYLRPAQLAVHPEGEKVLAALGPWGKSTLARLRAATGVELSELDAATIAIVVGDGGRPDACLRVELTRAWDDRDFVRHFPNSKKASRGKQNYHVVADRAYVQRGQTLVICPASMAAELIDARGETPQLVRDLEALAAQTDADRTATILMSPRMLDASGSRLLAGDAAPLRDALHWLIGDNATAVALSIDLQARLYAELRAAPALNRPARRLAIDLRQRVAAAPDAVAGLVAGRSWQPYGRAVLQRFPAMLGAMAQFSRAGEADHQAVVNCYLPPVAAHNLLMGAELLLTQAADAAAGLPAEAAAPKTIADRLAKVTSLSFPKETLQRAIELLADDLGLDIHIAGADLQADGITKNQSFALDLVDRPGGEILVEILRRANPDRTAAGPSDPRQKLVYVVETPAAGGLGRIIVTTRAGARKRGQPLPAQFLGTAN
jgi:hypothetical protein